MNKMKHAHFVEMRVFSKEIDDEELIRAKIKMLFPFERLKIEQTTVLGFEDKKIRILKVMLKKNSEINKFLFNLFSNLTLPQKELILDQLDTRVDEAQHFFLRLDKDALLEGRFEITDTGNCFHFKVSVAAYPSTKDNAKKIIRSLLTG